MFNSSFFLFFFSPKSGLYYYGLKERKKALTAFDLQSSQPCKRSAASTRTQKAQQARTNESNLQSGPRIRGPAEDSPHTQRPAHWFYGCFAAALRLLDACQAGAACTVFTAAFRVLARWAILKTLKNFLAHTTGEGREEAREVDRMEQRNKLTEKQTNKLPSSRDNFTTHYTTTRHNTGRINRQPAHDLLWLCLACLPCGQQWGGMQRATAGDSGRG